MHNAAPCGTGETTGPGCVGDPSTSMIMNFSHGKMGGYISPATGLTRHNIDIHGFDGGLYERS